MFEKLSTNRCGGKEKWGFSGRDVSNVPACTIGMNGATSQVILAVESLACGEDIRDLLPRGGRFRLEKSELLLGNGENGVHGGLEFQTHHALGDLRRAMPTWIRQGCAIRAREVQIHQSEYGSEESFCLAQRKMEDHAQAQSGQDRRLRVGATPGARPAVIACAN